MQEEGSSARATVYEWGTSEERVAWLLNTRFSGNRSEMARAIGFSHTAISKVVAGQKPPGRRLLTAIVEKLGVDAEWLLRGRGEPFGVKPDDQDITVWMPVSDRLLPERLPEQLRELTSNSVGVPGLRPSTQYWFHLRRNEPMLGYREYGCLQGDLLLLETDPIKFPSEERLSGHLCAVKGAPDDSPPVKLGAVSHYEASVDDGPGRLEINTFEAQPPDTVEEFVVRRFPDGTVEGLQRQCRKRQHRGRVSYVPVNQDLGIEPPLRRIKYSDIVAVWTGILNRRGRSPFA